MIVFFSDSFLSLLCIKHHSAGTTEEFDGAQRRRRIRDLKTYLNEMDADLSKEVLVAIKQDLKDLDQELFDAFCSDKKEKEQGETKEGEKIFQGPKCQNGHEMKVTDTLEGGYSGGWNCDKCGHSIGPTHSKERLLRWCCIECTADFCFNCNPQPSKPLGRRSGNNDTSLELTKEDVELAIKEEKLILVDKQADIEVGDDIVWKRGKEKNHRQKDTKDGNKDDGAFGTFLATKIQKKDVNGWGAGTACDLPECLFVSVVNKNNWFERTGSVYKYSK